jgi:hypothetical protein
LRCAITTSCTYYRREEKEVARRLSGVGADN